MTQPEQPIRYLSKEWKAIQYETQLHPDPSTWTGCGVGGPDGPCGGCDHCIAAQMGYYIHNEEVRCRTFQAAGFQVSDPSLIVLDYFPGFGGYHSSYDCRQKEERQDWAFPWEPKLGSV